MKVLVTGVSGQLGRCLLDTVPEAVEVIAPDSTALDLADPANLDVALSQFTVGAIINCAAFTGVDLAETEDGSRRAMSINGEAVQVIARYCQARGIPLIQVSTDFVFDGKKSSPYGVGDGTGPLGVYGQSKLRGEQYALSACDSAYVVRTGWVYSEYGNNFVKTMLRLAGEKKDLRVVADQVGTPTYARHLAQLLWRLLARRPDSKIYHFSNAGVASWYDFAVAIFEESVRLGLLEAKSIVTPVSTAEFPTPAKRPAYSVLDKMPTWDQLEVDPVHWRSALQEMLARLANHKLTN